MTNQFPLTTRETYNRAFYAAQVEESARSATVMVPIILNLLPRIASVVDLGCGTGVWLHHFKASGVPQVLGLDGGAPDDGMLLLRHNEFRRADLAKPVHLPQRFDLAMSIEVAEHLPPSAAPAFVANLCRLSDAVVFGAAIPGQGGTWHVNERWPSYWTALFEAEGFEILDVLRPQVWYDQRVEWWYAQNTVMYVRRSRDDLVATIKAATGNNRTIVDIVHPRCFEAYRRPLEHLTEMQARAESSEARLTEMQARAESSEARLTEMQARAESSEARLTEMQARAESSEARLTEMQARAESSEARLTAILYSTSWRISGPFRRLTQQFPRFRSATRAILAPVWRTLRTATRRFSVKP